MQAEQGVAMDVAYDSMSLAWALAELGESERAIRIWSASDRMRNGVLNGAITGPTLKKRHEDEMSKIRTLVGEDLWLREWSVGQAMSVDEMVNLALHPRVRRAGPQRSGGDRRSPNGSAFWLTDIEGRTRGCTPICSGMPDSRAHTSVLFQK